MVAMFIIVDLKTIFQEDYVGLYVLKLSPYTASHA
jgi:hypothetical protein